MMARRAQVNFGETMMVTVILIFLLVAVMVFYSRVNQESVRSEIEFSKDINAIKLAKIVESMPDISCGIMMQNAYCIDELKVIVLANMMNDESRGEFIKSFYQNMLGYSRIEIIKGDITSSVPCESSTDNDCTILFYENKPIITSSSTNHDNNGMEKMVSYHFITIYNPLTDSSEFATMKITRYIPLI